MTPADTGGAAGGDGAFRGGALLSTLSRAAMRVATDPTIAARVSTSRLARDIATAYVAGETASDAVATAVDQVSKGLEVSLHPLDTDARTRAEALCATEELCDMIGRIGRVDSLTGHCEVSISLSALGLTADEGDALALENAARACEEASRAGVLVTVDDEGPAVHDRSLRVVTRLLDDHPDLGLVVQAARHDSLTQIRELAVAGRRIRLCKGSYTGPRSVTLVRPHDIDLRMATCLRNLMTGPATVLLATHDPVFVALGEQLMIDLDRPVEFQMLQGIRPLEQRRLVDVGHRVRVYLPWGRDWYRYCTRRIVERPSNIWLFSRSLVEGR